MRFIPVHPAQNLHLPDGVYAAEIREVADRAYNIDSRLIHVLFWLPEEHLYLCTTFYFPHGYSIRSQQRLWHLCRAVGLELHQVVDEPEQFTGKRMRIKTYSVSPKSGRRYNDVELFLPQATQQIEAAESGAEFCAW